MRAICIYTQKDKKYFDMFLNNIHVSRNHQRMKIIPHEHSNTKKIDFKNDINSADIVFLLVSVDAMNITSWIEDANLSVKYCNKIRVIPIRIDDTSWTKKSFENLQCLPINGRSIKSYRDYSDAFCSEVAPEVEKTCQEVISSRKLDKQQKQRQYNESIYEKELLFYEQTQKNLQPVIIGGFVVVVVGILLFSQIFSANSVCSTTIKPEIYLQQAEAQEKDKNFQKAIEKYSCAIQSQPNNFEAYRKRGKIYFDEGNYEIAIDDFTKALEDKDLQTADLVFFLHRRGEANRKIWEATQNDKNKKDALKNYDKVIKLNKEYAYAYFGRGELYKSSGEKALALSNFERALFYFKRNPNEKRNVKLAEEKIKELK